MAKITRKTAVIFGQSAGFEQIAEFGSLAVGTPTFTTDPAVIQSGSFSAWLGGWFSAILGGNSPAIEDMNAFCFVMAYQIAYGMQAGVAEYDSGTTYYTNSYCNYNGVLFISLADANIGNTPSTTSNSHWVPYGGFIRTVTTGDTATVNDAMIRVNNGSSAQAETLPAISATPVGKSIIIKRLQGTTANVTVTAAGSDTIDGAATYVLELAGDSVTVKSNGTSWDVV